MSDKFGKKDNVEKKKRVSTFIAAIIYEFIFFFK